MDNDDYERDDEEINVKLLERWVRITKDYSPRYRRLPSVNIHPSDPAHKFKFFYPQPNQRSGPSIDPDSETNSQTLESVSIRSISFQSYFSGTTFESLHVPSHGQTAEYRFNIETYPGVRRELILDLEDNAMTNGSA